MPPDTDVPTVRGAAPPHALPAAAVLARLGGAHQGLSCAEAARRLRRHGPNRLPGAPRPGLARRILAQFASPLVQLLAVAALVLALIGHPFDAGVIAAVILVNAGVGLFLEGRAEGALAAVSALLAPRARVLRDGARREIDAADLVSGDVVALEAGDHVPADLRILEAAGGLHAAEATLTGESLPVEKSTAAVAEDAPLGDRACMLFAGTLVTSGTALGLVVATASATEVGRIGTMLRATPPGETPLLHQVARIGGVIGTVVLGLAIVSFLLGVLVHRQPLGETLLAAVALAVAAVPEELPALVTVTLAVGVERLARRRALVRQLPAVETLGSVTVICSDKTGTFTRNEMAADRVLLGSGAAVEASGTGYAPEGEVIVPQGEQALLAEFAAAAALCNDAALARSEAGGWSAVGDPLEAALLALAHRAGVDPAALRRERPRRQTVPFDAARAWMATLQDGAPPLVVLKGAPERVLPLCADVLVGVDRQAPLDAAEWLEHAAGLAASGRRVLALARRSAAPGAALDAEAVAGGGFTLLGLVGLLDPPRQEAADAIAACQAAGIRVVMITGDHAVTAASIARSLGLARAGRVVTGAEIAALDRPALIARAADTDVFARVAPEQKLALVEAMQARGEIVAMTGDGVNDAPALARADIGVAMGRGGTDAARAAARIVLADDNFATIARAVREGRVVADNLRKALVFALPANGGEALVVVVAVAFGLTLPLAPLHLLWVNLVTTVALSLALAFEPPEPGVMARPPRPPGASLLDAALLRRVLLVSLAFLAGVFGVFFWARASGGATLEEARTAAVNALVLFQVAYLFNVHRGSARAADRWRGVLPVLLAALATLLLQLLLTYAPPLQAVFETRPLGPGSWAAVALASLLVFALVEAEKRLTRA